MKNHLLLSYLFLISSSCYSIDVNEVMFDPNDPKPAHLDLEESKLNLLNRRADDIIKVNGIYEIVRDQYYFGQNGVVNRTENLYEQKIVPWLSKVTRAKTIVNNATDLTDKVILEDLKSLLNEITYELPSIVSEMSDINLRARLGLELLKIVDPFPNNFIDEYHHQTSSLNRVLSDLVSGLDQHIKATNTEKSDSLINVLNESRSVFDDFILKKQLEYPNLEIALGTARETIFYYSTIPSMISDLSGLKRSIMLMIQNDKRFSADKRIQEFEDSLEEHKQTISSLLMSDQLKQKAINEIDSIETALVKVVESSDLQYSRYERLESLYVSTMNQYARLCRYERMRKRINCNILRSISGLDRLTITNNLTYDEGQALEKALIAVHSGPILGTEGDL